MNHQLPTVCRSCGRQGPHVYVEEMTIIAWCAGRYNFVADSLCPACTPTDAELQDGKIFLPTPGENRIKLHFGD